MIEGLLTIAGRLCGMEMMWLGSNLSVDDQIIHYSQAQKRASKFTDKYVWTSMWRLMGAELHLYGDDHLNDWKNIVYWISNALLWCFLLCREWHWSWCVCEWVWTVSTALQQYASWTSQGTNILIAFTLDEHTPTLRLDQQLEGSVIIIIIGAVLSNATYFMLTIALSMS